MSEDIEQIRLASQRAGALTRQLLTFSRQSLREVTLVSLNAVIREAETMLRRVIGEDIVLTVDLDPADAHVRANPDQMGQVLLNLALNARDAMPRGGNLVISTCQEQISAAAGDQLGLAPGRYALLRVSDTGSGMPPEVRARIFEPFFTTRGAGGGTGLGLAVVHGIIAQSHGAITVESAPDQGTVFRVALPALEPEALAAGAPGHAAAAPSGSELVLLVEDDTAVRQMVAHILRRQGYQLLVAASGPEALLLAERHPGPLDLVLTDVVMPGQSGPELIEELRRRAPRLRAIIMSGYAPDTALRHGMPEGAHNFLSKPFTPDALARRVREVLDT
jgi:CheY-like chemotaxis protein/two-component sensor histidine kinase